jgi:hypothetical protein
MKITAQTMELNNLALTIEKSADNQWSVDIYRDLDEGEGMKHTRILSVYLTSQELSDLYDLTYQAKYLAKQQEEIQ